MCMTERKVLPFAFRLIITEVLREYWYCEGSASMPGHGTLHTAPGALQCLANARMIRCLLFSSWLLRAAMAAVCNERADAYP